MKKSTLFLWTLAAIVATNALCAQPRDIPAARDRGWWIGGEVSFWHSTSDGLSSNSYAFAPEAGYDFNSRWAVGAGIGYAGVDYETGYDEGTVSASVVLFTPYARWKYCNAGRVSLFLDGGLGVAGGDIDGFRVGIQPGLTVRIANHVRFVAHVGFLGYCSNYFNDPEADSDSDGFGFRLSSSDLRFGFHYMF